MTMEVSLQQLDTFAAAFWQQVQGTKVFAFHGTMGAGKTTVITALCRSKGVQDAMGSPTFSIINEYKIPDDSGAEKIFHMDLYRLNDEEEVVQAGVEDCVYSGAICFVEWPEKATLIFDAATLHVVIKPIGEGIRRIQILTAAEFSGYSVAEQL